MLRKIRSLVSDSSFIQIYDNALSKKECDILINQFEKSDSVDWGYVAAGYRPESKKCRQLSCYFSNDDILSNITNTGALNSGLDGLVEGYTLFENDTNVNVDFLIQGSSKGDEYDYSHYTLYSSPFAYDCTDCCFLSFLVEGETGKKKRREGRNKITCHILRN